MSVGLSFVLLGFTVLSSSLWRFVFVNIVRKIVKCFQINKQTIAIVVAIVVVVSLFLCFLCVDVC